MRIQKNKGISRMGKLFLVLALGISLVYLPVAAQEDTAPAPATPKLKSEALAFRLSLYGTLIPLTIGLLGVRLAFLGCLIGPSLGYFYGGLPGRALPGIGIRSLAGAVAFVGVVIGAASFFAGVFGGSRAAKEAEEAATIGSLLALGGVILFAGSSLLDIFSVKSAVWERNQRLQEKKLSLAPFYIPSSRTVGIQVQFSF
jgi:uncharacterized membrane protein